MSTSGCWQSHHPDGLSDKWTDREELPPVIACGETRINPIGKVVKRVACDDRGDLTAFYAQFIGS